MKVDRVLRRLQQTPTDRSVLRSVARDFADELPRNRRDVLCTFRAGVAPILSGVGDEWATGYYTALADIGAGYEATLGESLERAEAEAFAKRRGWSEVLEALAAGALTQRQLAEKLDKDESTISKTLPEMRAIGLIELARSESGDPRAKPHRLTPKGEQLRSRVRAKEDELDPAKRQLLNHAVSFVAGILFEGVTHKEVLKAEARRALERQGVDPESLINTLEHMASKLGLLTTSDDSVQAADFASPKIVHAALRLALEKKTAPFFWEKLDKIAPAHEFAYLVRPARQTAQHWDTLLGGVCGDAVPLAEGSRAIRPVDLREDGFPFPSRPFILVYDNPPLYERDRYQFPALEDISARAAATVVLVEEGENLDGPVKRVDIGAYVVEALAERQGLRAAR